MNLCAICMNPMNPGGEEIIVMIPWPELLGAEQLAQAHGGCYTRSRNIRPIALTPQDIVALLSTGGFGLKSPLHDGPNQEEVNMDRPCPETDRDILRGERSQKARDFGAMEDAAEGVGLPLGGRRTERTHEGYGRGMDPRVNSVTTAPSNPTTLTTAAANMDLIRECIDLAGAISNRLSPSPAGPDATNAKPSGLMDMLILTNQQILTLRGLLRSIEQTV